RVAEWRHRGDSEGVQDRRAMGVDDAARAAGRSAREAHRRGLALIQLRVAPVIGIGGGEQVLVRVLDDEDMLDVEPVLELLPERYEALVEDQHAIVAMARDEVEVLRVEPEVERVEDEAAARDPEVGLEVLVVVPAEGGDAVAALEPEALE